MTDVSKSCYGAAPCTELQPEEAVCFYVDLQNLFSSPAHFGLALSSLEGAGVELYGLFASDKDQAYPNSTSSYNFVVAASPTKPEARMSLDRDAVGGGRYSAMYLCAYNNGQANATFGLHAAVASCPFSLSGKGEMSICSSTSPDDTRHTAEGCPTGMCTCTGNWARPKAPVFEGLGFEDCSAASYQLPEGPHSKHPVSSQPPGTWTFFNFTISGDAHEDRYVFVAATATANTTSDLELYLAYWQPPGRQVGQYDLRSDPGDFRRRTRVDLSSGLNLPSSSALYKPGTWFLGAYVVGDQPVSYVIELFRSSCPNDCVGGRGTCAKDTGVCTCAKEEYEGEDCSRTSVRVPLGTTYTAEPRTAFASDQFVVDASEALKAASGIVTLTVEAAFTAGPSPLPAWVTERPILMASGAGYPTWDNATQRLMLNDVDVAATMVLEAAKVPNGLLYLTFFNPISYPYQVGYRLTVKLVATCLSDCSGHGSCNMEGRCTCEDNWAGADCSVDTAALAKRACQEGSLKQAFDVNGGSAYSVCVCSSPSECTYVTTDSSSMDKAVVVCSSGYELKGVNGKLVLSDGREVPTGGICAHIRRGTSGGMVFFYCMLTLALFCGAVVGGRYGLEYYQQWRLAQVGGYTDMGSGGGGGGSLWDAFTGRKQGGGGGPTDTW
eukprot:CAMPEP_0202899682 /NCGR_PEP_ID=MMETSP1392-20130828/7853_1 /ASSEMBLY_ACC=CAM_ASM_000868 /TAXON_ID=225041 /ORGANISM="Chlamydomonas chlamydogama, Strain SAG 11-48b" /LENGTH=664 /DNA_ID=CAMNT_0049585931 /DNA_START=266 /DNA_END=2260 /DNA_ORIENTATION=-